MLRSLSEQLGAKSPGKMVKNARLDDTFSEIFKLEAVPLEGLSLRC